MSNATPTAPQPQIINLMDALKASIAAEYARRGQQPPTPQPPVPLDAETQAVVDFAFPPAPATESTIVWCGTHAEEYGEGRCTRGRNCDPYERPLSEVTEPDEAERKVGED